MSGAAAAADAFRSEVYKFYMSDDALAGLDSAVVADHYADVTAWTCRTNGFQYVG